MRDRKIIKLPITQLPVTTKTLADGTIIETHGVLVKHNDTYYELCKTVKIFFDKERGRVLQ